MLEEQLRVPAVTDTRYEDISDAHSNEVVLREDGGQRRLEPPHHLLFGKHRFPDFGPFLLHARRIALESAGLQLTTTTQEGNAVSCARRRRSPDLFPQPPRIPLITSRCQVWLGRPMARSWHCYWTQKMTATGLSRISSA